MKVAVVNTGPGVNCPTATASISCFSLSQCRWAMNSVWRKARSTYPLPNTTEPIFRNERNRRHRVTGANATAEVKAATPAPNEPENGRKEETAVVVQFFGDHPIAEAIPARMS